MTPKLFSRSRRALADKIAHVVARAVTGALQESEARHNRRHEELLTALRAWERRQRRDVFTALDQQAAASSAHLVRSAMPHVALHYHPHETLLAALADAPSGGLTLEFGVATGTTLRLISDHRPGPVFGFDSFEGLPEPWRPGFDRGAFSADAVPDVPEAELVVGLFEDVLPAFLRSHPGPAHFVHLDADLYSSTATVLSHLGCRFIVGTVLLFDEYYNYPGWQEHEFRAWTEYVQQTGTEFEYIHLTMDDEQVAVRVTGLPRAS